MWHMNIATVITTINPPNAPGVLKLLEYIRENRQTIIVIGDLKTPSWSSDANVQFKSLEDQEKDFPILSKLLPLNHYSRKNIGYVYALKGNYDYLFDTDDDNYPSPKGLLLNSILKKYRKIDDGEGWINIYRYFGQNNLWPRGIPLEFVNSSRGKAKAYDAGIEKSESSNWSCFQSLVDGDPDLDAIGRMLFPGEHVFSNEYPILLKKNQICPTNSQATIWKMNLLPFLYLPITASFRMTDIWRGIIAQEYMSRCGLTTAFGKLGISQIRNEHDLIQDFIQEIDGHIKTKLVQQVSRTVWQSSNASNNNDTFTSLIRIYEILVEEGVLGSNEIPCLSAYLECFS